MRADGTLEALRLMNNEGRIPHTQVLLLHHVAVLHFSRRRP